MDLHSTKSCSYKTNTSADDDIHDDDTADAFKELAAYYNHIVRNIKTTKGKSSKRFQARLDGNANRTYPNNSLPTKHNNRALHINDDHQASPTTMIDRKLSANNITKSIHNHFETHIIDSDHVSCSTNHRKKVNPKATFVKHKNKYESFNKIKNIVEPSHAEKTTYCRPAIDMYNQEFIYKTMERNARLKGLLRRLVLAREREKQNVAWNNYINELKNKHRHYSSDPRTIPNYMPEDANPDLIDDYYNTRFACKQSNPCQNLLQDFYSASNEMYPDIRNARINRPLRHMPYTYENSRLCFPTSSQGRLMMLNRERPKFQFTNQLRNRPVSRNNGIPIFVDKENGHPSTSKPGFKRTQSFKLFDLKKHNAIKSLSVQTDLNVFQNTSNDDKTTEETLKEKYNKVTSNVDRLKQKIMHTQNEVKYCSLASIENKLDDLILAINTFITEVKSQKLSTDTKTEAVSCQLSNVDSIINATKSDTFGIVRRERNIICGMVQERPRSTLAFNEEKHGETLDKILYEEMRKSNKVKRDIEEILNKPNRDRPSVHITFDIPTKETATEITDSLFKARHSNVVIEEIRSQDNRMTIAVNTDPLGLLALFRVSAETVKQILSYMPHIDYYSYLSRLPLPQMSRNEMSHYVCNICGAAFSRPSQLSDHIQQHNLGNVRDCCVCRHVLDMQRHRAGLFSCRHCGQRFTRAYCRELHEQECAKALGRRLDDSPSLILLR